MNWLFEFFIALADTVVDVLPIVAIIFGFQLLVIRKPIANLRRTLTGFARRLQWAIPGPVPRLSWR